MSIAHISRDKSLLLCQPESQGIPLVCSPRRRRGSPIYLGDFRERYSYARVSMLRWAFRQVTPTPFERFSIMCMHVSPLEYRPSLSPSQIADLRLAASQMSGPTRRAFEAEVGGEIFWGSALLGET